ncbi:hypothetical protein [Arenimonas sp.]|uniref:hypothetical protein n=1 Tax=Arenimonas sp. TaxID=1872635 RepID=UPI0035B19F8F
MDNARKMLRQPGPITRGLLAGLLGLGLVACRGEPELPYPDFLSPQGRQVLIDAHARLVTCQGDQVTIAFAEMINLANPVSYSAGMVGQSVGQGSPDLPMENTLAGVIAFEKVCCEEIERSINDFSIGVLIPARGTGAFSAEEDRFWRNLSSFVASGERECRLPQEAGPDYGWPSG